MIERETVKNSFNKQSIYDGGKFYEPVESHIRETSQRKEPVG